MELLQNFYETTLDALRDAKNERLWFKTMTKLGKLYFDRCETVGVKMIHFCRFRPNPISFFNLREEFNRLARILKQLRQSCQTEEGEDDLKKGTQLLEVFNALSPFCSSDFTLDLSGVCPWDPDVHSSEKQQKAEGFVRPKPSHQVRHSPPPYPWSHQVCISWLQIKTNHFVAGSVEVRCTCGKGNLRKLTQTSLRLKPTIKDWRVFFPPEWSLASRSEFLFAGF